MTTPQPLNSDQLSGAATQPGIKPLLPYVALLMVTLLAWNPLLNEHGLDDWVLLRQLSSLVNIAAAVGMVRQERLNAKSAVTRQSTTPFIALIIAVALISLLNLKEISRYLHYYVTVAAGVAAVVASLAAAIACTVIRSSGNLKFGVTHAPAALGYTTDGQPIYPVVGYTPDGQPVTADRAIGIRPTSAGTNSMAIVAVITGLTIAPLGIVFGHIALSQIKQTGQGGRGLAIAGLVLGYVSVALYAIIFVAVAV